MEKLSVKQFIDIFCGYIVCSNKFIFTYSNQQIKFEYLQNKWLICQ